MPKIDAAHKILRRVLELRHASRRNIRHAAPQADLSDGFPLPDTSLRKIGSLASLLQRLNLGEFFIDRRTMGKLP